MGDLPAAPFMPGSDYTVPEAMQGSPMFGKPPGKHTKESHDAMMEAMGMSTALWKDTADMRGNITDQLTGFTEGDYDVTQNPMFAPGKLAAEDVYARGRDNIVSSMPSGGTMQSALGDLEGARMRGLTDTISSIQQDMYNKAYGAGYGVPQTSIAGANQSAGNMSQAVQMQNMAAGQNAQGFGQLLGYVMKSQGGK